MAPRIPRGYARFQAPYNELFEGKRPSLSDLGNLVPAPWLPVAYVDEHHNDPVVLAAGTWVGRINAADNSAMDAVSEAGRGWLVPACASTGGYTVTYTSDDVTHLTPDVDDFANIAAAGASTIASGGVVKPIGIVSRPIYASHLATTYTNYNPDHMTSLLSWGYTVMVPARTANELLIQAGDMIGIEDNANSATTWQPQATTNVVARLEPAGSTNNEFTVGRCIEKVQLATQTTTASTQTLAAAIAAGNIVATSVHNFGDMAKVQTVPNLGIQGSGTLGLPGWLLDALPNGSDQYFALVISVNCV